MTAGHPGAAALAAAAHVPVTSAAVIAEPRAAVSAAGIDLYSAAAAAFAPTHGFVDSS
eukprot:CAMPEP_0206145076 /NCGR_PEP_ID=MMETSP1473-20131121/26271_1 /ASSEMBLY_ACC=CAM_ASM_001109 /TAXON_ID=1461547 /ORGANISM="Stichococcus sp, Strain RCC1054" /LENGTH=57 /DNA_ID=CAMNT_0053541137 /DNA_START=214 /DNA_END=387 /DNA_ORIENTATION=+